MDTTDQTDNAVQIITAFVSNNAIAPAGLPELIDSVFSSLRKNVAPEKEEAPPEQVEEQATKLSTRQINASIKPDSLTCLFCGKGFKTLRRHIQTVHNMGDVEYRKRWGLPHSYPMTAPAYSEERRSMAVRIGLGRGAVQKRGRKPRAVNA